MCQTKKVSWFNYQWINKINVFIIIVSMQATELTQFKIMLMIKQLMKQINNDDTATNNDTTSNDDTATNVRNS